MKTARTKRIGRYWLAAATAFAGGTVLGTCELRMRDAFMTTAQGTVLTAVTNLPTLLGLDTEWAFLTADTTTDESETDGNGDEASPAE